MNTILNIIQDKKIKLCLIYTFLFGLLSHGYFFFNTFFTHDSSLFFQNDVAWQVQLGRFLQPIIFFLRGNYYVLWLVGFISLLFISLSAYLIIDLLPIKSKIGIIFTCGILVMNSTITCLNATYAHDSDIYMISFFFSVLGVYLIRKVKKGYLFAPLAFFISLGLYQSFINVIFFLSTLILYSDLLNKKTFKEVLKNGFCFLQAIIIE